MPGETTSRASMSASMMGREWGGERRREETVDLPVAMEPVRPIIIILLGWVCEEGRGRRGGFRLCSVEK